MRALLIITAAIFVTGGSLFGADFYDRSYGTFGAEYLKRPQHANSSALANSVTAWEAGLAGVQFNPALLAGASQKLVQATYTALNIDQKFNGISYSQPVFGLYAFNVSLIGYGVTDIEEAIEDPVTGQGVRTGNKFDDDEIAFDATFAGKVPGLISYGARLRYLYQKVGDYSEGKAHGAALDIGVYYEPIRNMGVGFAALNVPGRLAWESGRDDWVVPTFRLGVAGNFLDSALAAEVDIMKPWGQPIEFSLGIQAMVLKILALRAGVLSATGYVEDDIRFLDPEWFFGVGVTYSYFTLDYAALKPWSVFGLGHKFTLSVGF